MKAFLLLLVITTANTNGGVSVTTERFYVPSESACLEVKALFEADHTWITHNKHQNQTVVASRAIATCIPMLGVQNMKNQ